MLGVSRTIYVNVDSPNLGSPYFNILGEAQCKKHPVYECCYILPLFLIHIQKQRTTFLLGPMMN